MNRQEALFAGLFRSVRTIAVVGASPRPERHSNQTVAYLHEAGYDVIPIRPDRRQVRGLPTYAQLDDVAGHVDLVVMFRRPDAVPAHIQEAADKRAEAVWLQPGTWSREAEAEAERHNLLLVKDRCVIEEHRHVAGAIGEPGGGHPEKTGVHIGRRGRGLGDAGDTGYVAGGGGGGRAGGGVRAILDEKKMKKRKV